MKPARILIVEDETIVALDIQDRLLELGYEAAGVADRGEEALELVAATQPDLVLMDIRLKGEMDGIEAAEEIRRRWRIPIIFLTAFSEDSTLERAKASEPFGYIIKPFEDREIQAAIEMALYKHRVEERLRESEKRYRLLFESNPHPMWVHDLETLAFLAVNEAAVQHYGYSQDEFLSMTIADVGVSKGIESQLQNGGAWSERRDDAGIHRHRLKDGRIIDVEITSHTLMFGDRLAELVLAHDVTERRRAEEALRQANLVLENSPAVLFRWKAAEGWPVEMVSRNVNQFGYSQEELLSGKIPFASMVHPEDLDRVAREVQDFTARCVDRYRQEYRLITRNGEVRWVDDRTVVERDAFGQVVAYQGVILDVTDRKRAEEEREEALALLEAAIAQSPSGIIVADAPDLRIRMGNLTALHVPRDGHPASSGLSADAYVSDLKAFHSDGTAYHPEELPLSRAVLRGETTQDEEVILRGEDGVDHWVSINASPVRSRDGQIKAGVAILHDITDRKRAEAERLEMERRLLHAQKLESLGVLAGGIAHDFNNLLMAILGYADLALLELSPASPARPSLQEIVNASHRAAELCRQMLAYSGRGKFVIERLRLDDVVQEMIHMLKTCISKKVLLNLNLAKDLPPIEGDPGQVRQVLMNLVLNASEAIGDRSGVVTVSTGARYCDADYLRETFIDDALPEGVYVSLEVSDTGCGMDRETQARIFEPFFTTKFTGRGLGMAAVLGIVRGHKGALKVYSEPGRGTTFRILFPALTGASEDAGIRELESQNGWRGQGTVLLVDDEETILAVGRLMLEKLGFSVITAVDGKEAVDIYKERGSEVALVLLDLTMPHMNGEEAFRELRRIDPGVRVIISSGYSEQEIAARFAGKGLAGFIQKPYQVAKLREAVMRIVGDG